MSRDTGAPAGVSATPEAEIARLEAERARLQAEVDGLRAELRAETRRPPGGRPRRVATTVLVVMTSVLVTVAVTGVWARRNALNTDRWVRTVGPIAEEPAVQQALGNYLTTQVMTVIDAEEFFESALPERGQILAGPLTNALRGFVDDQVTAFLASDTFQRLWVSINERAHARVVAVLEGETPENLQIEGDDVVLNVVPVLNRILAAIGEESPEIFGRTVDLPTVSIDEVPQAAIERIEGALGQDLPEDFGQFTVFEARRLRQAQDAVTLVDRLVVAAVVLAIGLMAFTLWLSPHRRRTLLQLMVGIALGVVLVRRLGLRLGDDVVELAKPENREAVGVIVGAFVSSLLDATAWVLGAAVVVAAVAVLTAPYPWVRALRHRTSSVARTAVAAGATLTIRRPDERTVTWVAAHREPLQLGGIVVGILVLLAADLSWLGVLALLVAVGAFELAVHRIADLAPSAGATQTDLT
jgi:hypothetical protein